MAFIDPLLPVAHTVRASVRTQGVCDLPLNPTRKQKADFEKSCMTQHLLRRGQVYAIMGWKWPDVAP